MVDDPQVHVFPLGLEDEYPDGPPTAMIVHRGGRLLLRFADGDIRGEGDVQELRVLPDNAATLKPRVLRHFAPQAELYVKYARTAMRIFGPEGSPETRREQFRSAAEALRRGTGPGRGLTRRFYENIAKEYAALVDEGEPHPVKTLSENHDVKISAGSRWIKEARRLKLIPPKARQKG